MLNMIQRRTEHLRARKAWRWGAVKIQKLGLRPEVVFAREWARSPRLAGAVCPSGSALAEAMAARVPAGTGLVVDLGAGTGAVTAALLKKGIAAHRIVVVEQSASALLQPHVKVFFCVAREQRITPKIIHLSSPECSDHISAREDPEHWHFADLNTLCTDLAAQPW